MIKIFTLSTSIFLAGLLPAQLLTLHYGEEVVPNGSVHVVYGPADAEVLSAYLSATLNAAPARTVNVKRYELSVQPGTGNYFCWGLCYAVVDAGAMPFWASFNQHSLPMEPGVPLTNFAAYHEPRELVGTSTYRFVWYDITNVNDSAWVDIVFTSSATSVHELDALRSFNVYPSPSMGQDVEVAVDLAVAVNNAALVVYDMLGARIQSVRLAPAQTRTRLATQGLASGVYFATVEQGGTTLATRRFVVTH